MSTSTLFRIGAVLGLVTTVLFAIEVPFPDTTLMETLSIIALVCGSFSLLAIYLYHRESAGVLGDVGYFTAAVSNILTVGAVFMLAYVVPLVDEETIMTIVSGPAAFYLLVTFVMVALGGILFGLSVVRARVFHPLAGVFYGLGAVGIAAFFLLQLPRLVSMIATWIMVFGIAWASVQLWQQAGESEHM